MTKITFTISIIAGILILPNLLLASDIDIKIKANDVFKIDDMLGFDYTLTADEDMEDIIYYPYIHCDKAPNPLIKQETVNLKANTRYQDSYQSMEINNTIEPQECTAYIQILSPIEKKEQKWLIIETDPSFRFDLTICKDKERQEKTKVFALNETIYIDYASEIKEMEISAYLTYPNQEQKEISLPAEIKAEQTGNYELGITVSKRGYKTISQKDMFGVIEKKAEIQSIVVCNMDGVCDNNENVQNCPQDCAFAETKAVNAKTIILIIAAIIIIAIIIAAYLLLIRKKEFKQ